MNTELMKAVESLSREIADPEDCTAWQTILSALRDMEAEIAQLKDEIAAAVRDAERYAFLRELDGGAIYAITGDVDGVHPEQFDAAIDAALTQEAKTHD